MTYSEKLKDPRWQKKRLEILERDEFTCHDCNATNKTLHVHHCHYEKCDPWDARNDVLLTLCDNCHKVRGKLEAYAKIMLGQIMAKLPNAPDQTDLLGFVEDLAKQAQDPDCVPIVMNGYDYEEHSDVRWFVYACTHPEARRCYEEVIDRKPNWARIDARRLNEEPTPTIT